MPIVTYIREFHTFVTYIADGNVSNQYTQDNRESIYAPPCRFPDYHFTNTTILERLPLYRLLNVSIFRPSDLTTSQFIRRYRFYCASNITSFAGFSRLAGLPFSIRPTPLYPPSKRVRWGFPEPPTRDTSPEIPSVEASGGEL